jgi:hypothetical protein
LLYDCGFSDVEAMRWLFTSDDSLPGSPIEAIAAHRCSEVNRRAQALAYGLSASRRCRAWRRRAGAVGLAPARCRLCTRACSRGVGGRRRHRRGWPRMAGVTNADAGPGQFRARLAAARLYLNAPTPGSTRSNLVKLPRQGARGRVDIVQLRQKELEARERARIPRGFPRGLRRSMARCWRGTTGLTSPSRRAPTCCPSAGRPSALMSPGRSSERPVLGLSTHSEAEAAGSRCRPVDRLFLRRPGLARRPSQGVRRQDSASSATRRALHGDEAMVRDRRH